MQCFVREKLLVVCHPVVQQAHSILRHQLLTLAGDQCISQPQTLKMSNSNTSDRPVAHISVKIVTWISTVDRPWNRAAGTTVWQILFATNRIDPNVSPSFSRTEAAVWIAATVRLWSI